MVQKSSMIFMYLYSMCFIIFYKYYIRYINIYDIYKYKYDIKHEIIYIYICIHILEHGGYFHGVKSWLISTTSLKKDWLVGMFMTLHTPRCVFSTHLQIDANRPNISPICLSLFRRFLFLSLTSQERIFASATEQGSDWIEGPFRAMKLHLSVWKS